MEQIKQYKKSYEYSYCLGAFPTIEMLKSRPECVVEVYCHSSFTDMETIYGICSKHSIPVIVNDKLITKLSDKENVYVIGVFNKFECELSCDKPHIVLVNPSNMGNMGTIIRTAAGFGVMDMAFISPAADCFNPKTIRSSMGSIFRINHRYFDSFEQYRSCYSRHEVFTFMLNGRKQLTVTDCPKPELFSLVFGNEATGLDDSYLDRGTSIIIPQSKYVDSLNLTIAVGVGTYMFMQARI